MCPWNVFRQWCGAMFAMSCWHVSTGEWTDYLSSLPGTAVYTWYWGKFSVDLWRCDKSIVYNSVVLSMYSCKSPCNILPLFVGYAKTTDGLFWKPSEYRKSSINFPGTYLFQTRLRGWINRDGRFIWEGRGGALFNLAMMVVLFLPEELECKVENRKNKKLQVIAPSFTVVID